MNNLLSSCVAAVSCRDSGNTKWMHKYLETVEAGLPHGSGFNSGSSFDIDESDDRTLVFYTSFEPMDEGFYIGSVDFKLTVTPGWFGPEVYVETRGISLDLEDEDEVAFLVDDLEEYVASVFLDALTKKIE